MQGQKPNAFLIPVVCLTLSCLYLLCVPVHFRVSLGSSVFCLYWSVPSISAYLWPLCLVGFRRVSLSFYSLLLSLVSVCALRCFAPLFSLVFYVGFPLWRLLSLPGLFFAGCESVWLWFYLGLALLLPWVALWSFGCLVVCFALVYACGFWRWCPWCCRALWAFLLVMVVLGLLDRCLGQPCAILGYFAVAGLLGF